MKNCYNAVDGTFNDAIKLQQVLGTVYLLYWRITAFLWGFPIPFGFFASVFLFACFCFFSDLRVCLYLFSPCLPSCAPFPHGIVKDIWILPVVEKRPGPKVSIFLLFLLLIHGCVCPVNRRLNILYLICKPAALTGYFTGQWCNGLDALWRKVV